MDKVKVLLWADAPMPITFTGYGNVVANIFKPLYQTGKFHIEQIAINYHGDFFSPEECPWQLVPAKLGDPKDPYGTQLFLRAVAKNDYDIIWIVNDSFVAHRATTHLQQIFAKKHQDNKKIPKIVYYYPVDLKLKKETSSMITFADVPIAYAKYGYENTISLFPELKDKLQIIHHGTDTSKYFPYSKEIISKLKRELFNLDNEDFLIINVNRNTMRKQLWRNLVALKQLRKTVPNSYLYLHTVPVDRNINLLDVMNDLDLKLNKDVFFPPNYSPSNGYPDELLNRLMNCGDIYLTTSVGEGWGLADTQAMACGVPVIAPTDSVRPEIFGDNRGYLYPTKDYTFIDASGIRPVGLMKDIVKELKKVKDDGWKHDNPKVIKARKWVEANDWSHIVDQWAALFERIINEQQQGNNSIGEMIL